jgi:hypothetical protein
MRFCWENPDLSRSGELQIRHVDGEMALPCLGGASQGDNSVISLTVFGNGTAIKLLRLEA